MECIFKPGQTSAFRWVGLALLVMSLALTVGCFGRSRLAAKVQDAMLTENVAESDPEGLAVDVVDFEWAYYNNGSHIKAAGVVRNNTGQTQQAVTIIATLFDEKGEAVIQGRSFVTPTFLAPGAEGTFEVMGLPRRTKGIQFIRLHTRATVLH